MPSHFFFLLIFSVLVSTVFAVLQKDTVDTSTEKTRRKRKWLGITWPVGSASYLRPSAMS